MPVCALSDCLVSRHPAWVTRGRARGVLHRSVFLIRIGSCLWEFVQPSQVLCAVLLCSLAVPRDGGVPPPSLAFILLKHVFSASTWLAAHRGRCVCMSSVHDSQQHRRRHGCNRSGGLCACERAI